VIALPDGTAVGNVSTHHCDRRVGSFSYGINTLREHRGRGYASDAIRILLRYFVLELRYQKVTVGIFDFNETSIHLHRRLGFQAEGRLRRMTYGDGRFADRLIFGLLAEEFATP
jgi:RimJ/RimL family protein N-acetyltransferase